MTIPRYLDSFVSLFGGVFKQTQAMFGETQAISSVGTQWLATDPDIAEL